MIHIITIIIATPPFTTDVRIGSKSPKPETEIGPNTITAIPPPITINIHNPNKNPKIS